VTSITRRDFLDAMALAIGAGLAPDAVIGAAPVYPPGLTGLRGQHDGSFEAAHTMAFDGKRYRVGALPVEEEYDCIVVGAGISGLAAAHYYRERFGRDARILVLDNHDDFGGHARRNEFRVGGRLLIGYGGSEALQSPEANFSSTVNALMRELGVETERFRALFDQQLYPGLGLSRASFFDRERFGTDRLVTGDPTDWVADDIPPDRRNGRPLEAFIGDFPLSPESRRQLLEVHTSRRVDLARLPDDAAREDYLSKTSYSEFLRRDWGLSDEAVAYFDGRTRDFFGLPPNLLPALDCVLMRIRVSEASGCPRTRRRRRSWPSLTSTISRTATRRLPGCWSGNSCRLRCRGGAWTTSCSRRRDTRRSTDREMPFASAS
jgi:spermidine dehydrogenase